jgi:scaffold protein (connect acetoacetyl-CoA thiolase and HMG-CoA synthase)
MDDMKITKETYDRFLAEGKLMGVRCQRCGALYLPPRPLCRVCYGEALVWEEMAGRGRLAAFTTIHIAPSAMLEAGYDRDHPYCSGIVRLEEGPAISAQILGVDAARPEAIRIGTPLRLSLIQRGDGETAHVFLAFEPAEG